MKMLPKAGWYETILLKLELRQRFRVEGDSMKPTLERGDQLLIDKKNDVKVGDIVVARHPFKKDVKMVKRVKKIEKEGYFLISDNLEGSTDSRTLGLFDPGRLVGRVRSRLD